MVLSGQKYIAFLNCYQKVSVGSGSGSSCLCLCLRHDGNSHFSRLGLLEESLQMKRNWARPTELIIARNPRVHVSETTPPPGEDGDRRRDASYLERTIIRLFRGAFLLRFHFTLVGSLINMFGILAGTFNWHLTVVFLLNLLALLSLGLKFAYLVKLLLPKIRHARAG